MQAEPEWLTLAEAGDRVRITEVDDEGSVPDLRVANLGDLPVLLLDGEQLVGAKQNRCVERGRWATGSPGCRDRHRRWPGRSLSNLSCRYRADSG